VKSACARVLGCACLCQDVDRIRGSGRLSELKCNKIHGSGRLRAQTYDKIHNSGCLGTQKFAKICGSGRPKGAGFWCLPGVPPRAAKKKPPERLVFSSKHAFLEACQKWILEPFLCPEGVGHTSTPKYVGLEGLGLKSMTKYVSLESFGRKSRTKYVGLEGLWRKNRKKYRKIRSPGALGSQKYEKYVGLQGLGRKVRQNT
jgi:hypothetical protein